MKYALLLLALLSSTAPLQANDSLECEVWEVIDIPFTVTESIEEPFTVDFAAVLTHADGTAMKVPGFYDGDNTWVIRFCPPKAGVWKYATRSALAGLARKSGEVVVSENTNPNQHGPIVISKDDPQKFAYADGTPYFLMAFEIDWLFALDAGNPDAIPKTREIVSHLAENRFNHAVMNVYAYDASWKKPDGIKPEHDYARPDVFPYGGTNDEPDYSTLNLDFFKHLDRVITHLDENQIVSHLMIYVWNKLVNWPEAESEADNLYFDYVVKRYQAYPNLVWDISKEATGYGHNDKSYITRRIDRLRGLDGHGRLLSVHDYGYCNSFPDKIDFVSRQTWTPDLYNEMKKSLADFPNMPVVNIEHGGYERTSHPIFDGSYNDARICLDRNYQCVFAGTYSTYYWQNSSWYELIYNPSTLPENERPAFHYYRNLVKLFTDYDFTKLQPKSGMRLTDGKTLLLGYLVHGQISFVGSDGMLKGKNGSLKWFDPLTGKYHDHGTKVFKTWVTARRPEEITGDTAVVVFEVME